jgi:hypothetical protein
MNPSTLNKNPCALLFGANQSLLAQGKTAEAEQIRVVGEQLGCDWAYTVAALGGGSPTSDDPWPPPDYQVKDPPFPDPPPEGLLKVTLVKDPMP